MDFSERDMSAIAYTKSLLSEGDTLVFISYPGGEELYDPAGFKLAVTSHRVHSEKLLATGSTVFQKLLGDRAQPRAQKRAGFNSSNPLPAGTKYVLDLSPPDEGDEAVDLLSNLSCPPGIRHWAKTGASLGVDSRLIDGRDEFIRVKYYAIEDEITDKSSQEGGGAKIEDIPEYCPVRHRAGIERLLRIIEGRDPRLDSAPKVLTLAVLGKFFDCRKVVVRDTAPLYPTQNADCSQAGFIESWIMTEPNNKFIEILPEASFQIGLFLNSKMIIEPAFAVLVSEGAFVAAARMHPDFELGKTNVTLLGRPKEDMNEDELNRIEAAANDFQSRIQAIASKLTEKTMEWLQDLPEFRKLTNFREETSPNAKVQQAVDALVKLLRHYVRGRVMAVGVQPLSSSQNQRAIINRGHEHYLKPYDGNFEDIYDTLSYSERYITRFYWDLLRNTEWNMSSGSNMDFDFRISRLARQINQEISLARGTIRVNIPLLSSAQEKVNALMLSNISGGHFYRGKIPKECYVDRSTTQDQGFEQFWATPGSFFHQQPQEAEVALQLARLNIETPGKDNAHISSTNATMDGSPNKETSSTTPLADTQFSTPKPVDSKSIRVPSELQTSNYISLPFFSVPAFLTEVHSYLTAVCRTMLEDQYFGNTRYIDTIVCLASEELKYLPLWAGGNEDGTGGVFEKAIPPAEYGAAPNGPGPAYHTGLSVFSQASSIVDLAEDDQMTEVGTVNTSVAVDNGLTGHVDRRAIVSDFGSTASFVDVQEYEGNGKGKEVDTDDYHGHDEEDEAMVIDGIDDDDEFMIVSGDEEDLDDFDL